MYLLFFTEYKLGSGENKYGLILEPDFSLFQFIS